MKDIVELIFPKGLVTVQILSDGLVMKKSNTTSVCFLQGKASLRKIRAKGNAVKLSEAFISNIVFVWGKKDLSVKWFVI